MSNMKIAIEVIDKPFSDGDCYNYNNYPANGVYIVDFDDEGIGKRNELLIVQNNSVLGYLLNEDLFKSFERVEPKKELLGPLQGPYFMGNEKSEGIPIHIHEKALDIIMKMAGKE